MEELSFRCPAYLAQRFWLYCNEQGETPGSVLRAFMLAEIKHVDPDIAIDLKDATGLDEWSVRQGIKGEKAA